MELELRYVQRVVTQHIPGKLNDLADWLSRHDARREEAPKELKAVSIVLKGELTKKDFHLYLLLDVKVKIGRTRPTKA